MPKVTSRDKNYPHWVCHECGIKASKGKCFQVSTYHTDKCGVCGKTKAVTETRDFFYCDFQIKDKK